MKLSRFNVIIDLKGQTLVYNSFSRGVILLDSDNAELLKGSISKILDNAELRCVLEENGMLVQDNIDELKMLKFVDRYQRMAGRVLSLVVAPTMECNLNCWYCYEGSLKKGTMTQDNKDRLLDFILGNLPDSKRLRIQWYGGEPLLALDFIRNVSEKIIGMKDEISSFSAGMITNGYLLDEKTVLELKKLNVGHIQITLDGTRETHDRKRCLKNGKGTFDRILENISFASGIIPLTIRVNIDKENFYEMDDLLDILQKNNLKDKISIYASSVKPSEYATDNSCCMSESEYGKNELILLEKIIKRGFQYAYEIFNPLDSCAAVFDKYYIIDPHGSIYKCPMQIGRADMSVGSIDKGLDYAKLSDWILYDPFQNEECHDCKVQPICKGGCPWARMSGKSNGCSDYKENIADYTRIWFSQNI